MPNETTPDIAFPIESVKVETDRFCTQLTHRVIRYKSDQETRRNCKYEVYDHCIGTKVVQIVADKTYKFHDGCLGRVSRELAGVVRTSDSVVIEPEYAHNTALALNYILKPFRIASLNSKQKYDLVLFGARYGLPPHHISKLIDRSIYADLIEYAWSNNNTYLMTMLSKLRIPEVKIAEDLINIDDNIRLKFVRKYLEHEYYLKKCAKKRNIIIVIVVCVWLLLLYCAVMVDGPWYSLKNKGGQANGAI